MKVFLLTINRADCIKQNKFLYSKMELRILKDHLFI